jgi:hypothetical protein
MPLVQTGTEALEQPLSEAHAQARQINPIYAQGPLVRVAGGRNQAEAELIQGMLLEEGIPSILRRTRGFDVPDFLAAGPRDVMVPEAGYEPARQLLLDAEMGSEDSAGEDGIPGIGSPARLLTWVLVGLAGAAVLVWLLYQATA